MFLPYGIEDRKTAHADCLIALNIAAGVAIDDIDPSMGWNKSTRAYRTVRGEWTDALKTLPELFEDAAGANQQGYTNARAIWARLRPDLIHDWPQWAGAPDLDASQEDQ